MIIDGKKIAHEILHELATRHRKRAYTMAIISVAPNFPTQRYLRIKERAAAKLGIELTVMTLEDDATTETVLEHMEACGAFDGVVLQLPYPAHIDVAVLLRALKASQDCDAMGDDLRKMFDAGDETVLPPVVAAIAYSAHAYGVSFNNKAVVVIGKGRLVGAPATVWATRHGGKVVSLSNLDTKEPHLQTADIIILGAGVPALVSPSMIKNGVVIFDAGTSEEEGKLAGDADPSCASVASLMTPVPGGIGPIAVALLFSNLYTLGARKDALSID